MKECEGKLSVIDQALGTMKDINLRVCRGMRVAVCGAVSSDKSSLLSCMFWEVSKISGIFKLCGTKTYVTQSPWIQSGKIEENILLVKRWTEKDQNTIDTNIATADQAILYLLKLWWIHYEIATIPDILNHHNLLSLNSLHCMYYQETTLQHPHRCQHLMQS